MAVAITLRFDYPWNDNEMDDDEIIECLSELSPEELLMTASNEGKIINTDIEVY